MKIAFLIERNIYFRTFGPVINEALEKGHQVFCFHNYNQPKSGSKAYQFPYISQTPGFKNGKVISLDFQTKDEFIEKVLTSGVQVIVSLDFIAAYSVLKDKLKEKNVFWVSLQNGFDTGPTSGENLLMPDRFFIYSLEFLGWVFEYLKRTGKSQGENLLAFKNKLQEKVKPVGFWLHQKQSLPTPSEIKNKWGIPLNKKVVLLFPFPFGSSLKRPWTKYIYGWHNKFLQMLLAKFFGNKRWLSQVLEKQNDHQVCLAIKKFCENNNAVLLVKCRKKDPARKYLIKMAKKVIYDESFYPSTTMECFSVADICFNFYSTAALESVAKGVSNVCIAPDVSDWKDIQGVLWQTILAKEKDFFDFPGVSYLKTIPEIINSLPKKNFSDFSFNKESQSKYLQKFANNNIETAPANIIGEIEKLAEKR